MGKIVMPKNSALLNEIEAVLKIYYEANDWLKNDVYKIKLKEIIGDDQYQSSYTKKAQITSYFGFTVWEDINNPQSRRRITESGKRMYEAIKNNNTEEIQNVLMNALETTKFGRDNYGCPDSNSDVEPPSLYIRAILDLDYLTYREFAFLLWKLEDVGANYTDAILELLELRNKGVITFGEEANKYSDCKPIMILVRWGFLAESGNSSGGKHIIIAPEVKTKYENRLRNLKIYNIDMDCADPIKNSRTNISDKQQSVNFDNDRLTGGYNTLIYGVPGCGKSYTVKTQYCNDAFAVERVVFHPDYTYSDFVGQILPQLNDDEKIEYAFVPGPFTKIISEAYKNPTKKYCLIIEEINRGNAPAIFGDVFQLLDRDQYGNSSYKISNIDIAKFVYDENFDKEKRIYIPSNLFIIATMNTSDQNVFTLDTAFQRRWKMRMIKNDVDKSKIANIPILDTGVTWAKFNKFINKLIMQKNIGMTSSEDKRLGSYFVTKEDLEYIDPKTVGFSAKEIEDAYDRNRNFPEKIFKYLWDDAFKFTRTEVFKEEYSSLESLIYAFESAEGIDRFNVFIDNIFITDID